MFPLFKRKHIIKVYVINIYRIYTIPIDSKDCFYTWTEGLENFLIYIFIEHVQTQTPSQMVFYWKCNYFTLLLSTSSVNNKTTITYCIYLYLYTFPFELKHHLKISISIYISWQNPILAVVSSKIILQNNSSK